LKVVSLGITVALHCGKAHVQSQWKRANFHPMTSKSLKFFKFEVDVHDYLPVQIFISIRSAGLLPR